MTYWVKPEQYEQVLRVLLPMFRRPNQRTWEQYTEETGTWRPVHWTWVFQAVREAVDKELQVSDRPDYFYRQNFYGRFGMDCSKEVRPHLLKRLMTLPPDHNP